jgi:hypothetical protein
MTWFIGHLYTPLETASNYTGIADLHTLQIITAPATPFSSLPHLQHSYTSGDSSAPRAHVFTIRRISLNSTQPAWGPHYVASGGTQQKTPPPEFSYCCHGRLPSDSPDIVSAGTCLPSHCSEIAVYLFIYCIATAVLIVCFKVFAYQRVYTPQYLIYFDGSYISTNYLAIKKRPEARSNGKYEIIFFSHIIFVYADLLFRNTFVEKGLP